MKYKQTIRVTTHIGSGELREEIVLFVEAESPREVRDKIFTICKNAYITTSSLDDLELVKE